MKKTQLMGILNATPDSFYEKNPHLESAIAKGLQIFAEGADIIDVGGESTRPGAPSVSVNEELERVIPVIRELKQQVPLPISIDTMKVEVAAKAIEAGADWINDVSGFRDPEMRQLAASCHAKLCVMHMQGDPQTMQKSPSYDLPIVEHIKIWFSDILEKLLQAGVRQENIILDPGIGFGKTVAHNLEILHNLGELKRLGFPLLIGVSRKSFMGKILNKSATDLLPATLAMNSVAILSHVDYIRVHDIQAHRDIIDVLTALKELGSTNHLWAC